MNQSPSVTELHKSLHAVAAHGVFALADKKNDGLKNKYATLNAVVAALSPVLVEHGLSYSQWPGPSRDGDRSVIHSLITRISHVSGEWLECSGDYAVSNEPPRPLNLSQAQGLAMTYFKRYSLLSVFGISTGDDKDAEALSAAMDKVGQEPVYAPHWSDLIRGKWDGEIVEGYRTPLGEMSTEEKRVLIREKMHLKSAALAAFLYDSACGILDECGMVHEDCGHNFPQNPLDMTAAELGPYYTFAKATHTRIAAEKAAAAGEAIP